MTMSFANPDWLCDAYDVGGDGAQRVIAGLPAILLSNLDDQVVRRLGGVPFESGQAFVRTPLDGRLQAGGGIFAVDLRTGTEQRFDIVAIDDSPQNWTMMLELRRRLLPIGVS